MAKKTKIDDAAGVPPVAIPRPAGNWIKGMVDVMIMQNGILLSITAPDGSVATFSTDLLMDKPKQKIIAAWALNLKPL